MSAKIIRIKFSAAEMENVLFLMQSMRFDKEHAMIRALVSRFADEKREAARRYGGEGKSPTVARETKAERMRRIMQLDDFALTAHLKPILDEEFGIGPDDSISILTKEAGGMRVIRMVIKATGMTDEVGLDYYLKRWEQQKRLPELSTPGE